MTKKTQPCCPVCPTPINPRLSFCRKHWFELPSSLRDKITATIDARNFLEKSRAMKAALDWFSDQKKQQTGGTA